MPLQSLAGVGRGVDLDGHVRVPGPAGHDGRVLLLLRHALVVPVVVRGGWPVSGSRAREQRLHATRAWPVFAARGEQPVTGAMRANRS